jgi:hypothetical protein
VFVTADDLLPGRRRNAMRCVTDDRLGLERHNVRTLHGLRARMTTKLLALAASVWLNHYLGRPPRALAALAV